MTQTVGDVENTSRPRCAQCKVNLAKKSSKPGKYRSKCTRCTRVYGPGTQKEWRAFKKDYCENEDCTATALIPNQLDVDHIDGNKKNNNPSNLVTLCKNCHALKTYQNRDFVAIAFRDL